MASETESSHTNSSGNDGSVVVVGDSSISSNKSSPKASVQSESLSHEHELIDLVKILLKKVDALENHIIKLDVKIDSMREISSMPNKSMHTLGFVDMDKMGELGLPVASEADLEKLDERLKDDQEYKKQLVRQRVVLIQLKDKKHIFV